MLIRNLIRKALILSVWIFLVGCGPPWDTVTSVEGGYSIKMPSLFVVEQVLPVNTALGSLNYRLVGSDPTRFRKFWPFWSGHGPYVVAHADLPPKRYSQEDVNRLFDHERDRILGEAKRVDKEGSGLAQIILDKPISFRGHPGREVRIMFSDDKTSHTRMYFVGGRCYILYGVGKNLDTFFDSFTLSHRGKGEKVIHDTL
jgi:hypothetical protein